MTAFWNDKVSSVRMPTGWKVELFDLFSFTGKSVLLTQSSDCLVGINFNDMTSSFRVSQGRSMSVDPRACVCLPACRWDERRRCGGTGNVCGAGRVLRVGWHDPFFLCSGKVDRRHGTAACAT